MREIKAIIYHGDIVCLAQSNYTDSVQTDAFQRNNGMAVQQFAYRCAYQQDMVGTVCGEPQNVVIEFTVCVLQTQQNIFYEKLLEQATDRFCFLFNEMYEDDKLKTFDNAIMAEGYIVDVEEYGTNDYEQAMIHVKMLASKLTYLHKNNEQMEITISKGTY